MGIKTDTGPVFSCVYNYSLCNKLRATKKQCWADVIDCFRVEFLCFTPIISACNPSFRVCVHQRGLYSKGDLERQEENQRMLHQF